jgi:cell division protein FtsW
VTDATYSAVSARRPVANAGTDVRMRWRMGGEARGLIFVSAVLLAFGLVVLTSASSMTVALGDASKGATSGPPAWWLPFWPLIKQLVGVVAGFGLFAVIAKVDAQRLERLAWPLMVVSVIAMIAVLIFGKEVYGSTRYLYGRSVQPSEFAKVAVVIWVSMLVVKKGDTLRRLTKGLLPFLVVVGGLAGLAGLQPDWSVALLYGLLTALVLFVGGARFGHFIFLGAFSIPVLWALATQVSYVNKRVVGYCSQHASMCPASMVNDSVAAAAPKDANYQMRQSMTAIGAGGLYGRGLGKGIGQFNYVTQIESDFIGANIGEEWGFIGLGGVTILFAAYGLLGFRIARKARTTFLQLVAVGLTFTTVLTAYLHLGVVVGLLPTTGLTLPFISQGVSNLVLTIVMTGVLVNIGSTHERVLGSRATDPLAVSTG